MATEGTEEKEIYPQITQIGADFLFIPLRLCAFALNFRFRINLMVACRCWLGGEILVPKEKLVHRPSAYGIVRREDVILLMTTVGENGRYCLPGGGIEPWESNIAALERELKEEAGIQVAVGSLAHFQEDFFYYDPTGDAWHGLLFYYHCKPLTFDLLPAEMVDDESATSPQWVNIHTLHVNNLQPPELWLLNYFKQEIW